MRAQTALQSTLPTEHLDMKHVCYFQLRHSENPIDKLCNIVLHSLLHNTFVLMALKKSLLEIVAPGLKADRREPELASCILWMTFPPHCPADS